MAFFFFCCCCWCCCSSLATTHGISRRKKKHERRAVSVNGVSFFFFSKFELTKVGYYPFPQRRVQTRELNRLLFGCMTEHQRHQARCVCESSTRGTRKVALPSNAAWCTCICVCSLSLSLVFFFFFKSARLHKEATNWPFPFPSLSRLPLLFPSSISFLVN